MIRKQYLIDERDLVTLRKKMPWGSEANLIRACIKAALKLSDEEFRDFCSATGAVIGRPRIVNKENLGGMGNN